MPASMMIMIASSVFWGPWMFMSELVVWLALQQSHWVLRIDIWIVFLTSENSRGVWCDIGWVQSLVKLAQTAHVR
jgi:hypothetical protein